MIEYIVCQQISLRKTEPMYIIYAELLRLDQLSDIESSRYLEGPDRPWTCPGGRRGSLEYRV